VPLEFLLAALQGCLVGLNLVETPARQIEPKGLTTSLQL